MDRLQRQDKVQLQNVTYTYSANTPFEKEALSDVSVGFAAGRITGLIGHTGSGKSTLVQMLNGLLRPMQGKVYLDGLDIWENPKEIRQVRFRVGLVMQYPEYQLFDETVMADIGFGPKNMGLDAQEIRQRCLEAAAFAGVHPSLFDKSPFELSGGEKRRVAIAGVLAMKPEVLILDEPAAGLDPRGRKTVLSGIRRYNRETGATVILVSHSMEDLATYCDEAVVMKGGQVYARGQIADIFTRTQELVAIGLDVPQIARVAALLQKEGIALQGTLYTVEGVEEAILKYIGGVKN